jgi:hypothetical protein
MGKAQCSMQGADRQHASQRPGKSHERRAGFEFQLDRAIEEVLRNK